MEDTLSWGGSSQWLYEFDSRVLHQNESGEKMENIIYKEFNKNYKEEVIELVLGVQQDEFNVSITREEQPDLLDIENNYQVGGNFWIAIDNDEVVGTIGLLALDKNILALRKMFVKPEYRGKGISKKLLDIAKQFAKENDFKEIYLGTIEVYKAALKFYKKYDFIEIKKEELPEIFPVLEVDNRFFKYTV